MLAICLSVAVFAVMNIGINALIDKYKKEEIRNDQAEGSEDR